MFMSAVHVYHIPNQCSRENFYDLKPDCYYTNYCSQTVTMQISIMIVVLPIMNSLLSASTTSNHTASHTIPPVGLPPYTKNTPNPSSTAATESRLSFCSHTQIYSPITAVWTRSGTIKAHIPPQYASKYT